MNVIKIQQTNPYNKSYLKRTNSSNFVNQTNIPKNDIFLNSTQRPISFGSNFLTRIEGLICCCCGDKMTTAERFTAKLNEKTLLGTSKSAIAALSEFEINLHKTEKKCFTIIKKLSKKYPNSTLQELLIKEAPKHLEKLQLRQLRVLDQIDIRLKKLPTEIQSQISKISNDARTIIVQETTQNLAYNEMPFKRKVVLRSIEDLKNASPQNQIVQEIYEIAQKLPSSSNDVNSFFVKYSRRDSKEIGQRLVSKSISTIEHLLPKSEGGESIESNYLGECAGCNNARGSIFMNDWIAMNPKMLKNLKLNLKEIIGHIKSGKIVEHDNYPNLITPTIKDEILNRELAKEKPNKRLVNKFKSLSSDLEIMVKDFNKPTD